jgi:hypothetical protein
MKKILLAFIVLFLIALPVEAKSDKASDKSNQSCTTIQSGELLASDGSVIGVGFDDWGYNYQANLFNGMYCDAYRDAAWCQDYKDDRLSMKWNDAWLSNTDCDGDGLLDRHYGFDSYIGSGAWLTNHQSGEYQGDEIVAWDVSGDWILDFAGQTDNRKFVNLVQDQEGNVTGQFEYLSGGSWLDGGELVGNIVDDQLYLHYERPLQYNYNGDFYGTVSELGIIDGTFTDSHNNTLLWTADGNDAAIYNTCSWNYFVKIVAAPEDATEDDGFWYNADGVEIGPVIWGEFATIQEVSNDTCTGDHGLIYKSPVRAGLGNW